MRLKRKDKRWNTNEGKCDTALGNNALKAIIGDMINITNNDEYMYYLKNGTCGISPVIMMTIANHRIIHYEHTKS